MKQLKINSGDFLFLVYPGKVCSNSKNWSDVLHLLVQFSTNLENGPLNFDPEPLFLLSEMNKDRHFISSFSSFNDHLELF